MTRRIVLPPVSRERLEELGLLNPRGVRRAQPEAVEQRAFAAKVRREYPDLLWSAWPNGGKRSPRAGAMLKAEGVNPGPPDLWFFEPRTLRSELGVPRRSRYVGLVIEMKAGKNKPTVEQKRWLEGLERRGWSVAVAYSAEEAWDILTRYLAGEP